MSKRIKAYSDIFIKYLFGSEGNEDILLDFINDVLGVSGFTKITKLKILNPFKILEFQGDKESILDVEVMDENGKYYNVEIQSTGNEIYKHRPLYYWAKTYKSQLGEFDSYKKLKPVITINILNFVLIKESQDYHNWFFLAKNNDIELVLSDHLYIHFLEMPKLPEKFTNISDNLVRWLYFLRDADKEDKDMKIIIGNDDKLKKAKDVYDRFNQSKVLRSLYDKQLEARKTYITDIEQAKEEGLEEGLKEGKEEGLKKTAKNLKKMGLDIDKIMEATGLSKKEIEEL
ncbi:MAG: Rpn family recombination-promoting nuclease/putative transposase [Spirochaetota bacterium]